MTYCFEKTSIDWYTGETTYEVINFSSYDGFEYYRDGKLLQTGLVEDVDKLKNALTAADFTEVI